MRKIIGFGFMLIFSIGFLIKTYAQGLIFKPAEFEKGIDLERSRADVIPSKASLMKYAPYTLTQNRSNCVAYSFASARTILFAKNVRLSGKDTISAYLFSPHWIYYRNKDQNDNDCYAGLDIEKTAKDILINGIPFMADVEYDQYYPFGTTELCNFYPPSLSDDILSAKKYSLDQVYRVKNLEGIKLALSKGMPLVVGMLIPASFKSAINKELWSPLSTDSQDETFAHAMVIIGYDDNKFDGAVHILNSWGEKWGNGGYIWIKYSDFVKYTLGAYALEKNPKLGESNIITQNKLVRDQMIKSTIDTNVVKKFNSLQSLMKYSKSID